MGSRIAPRQTEEVAGSPRPLAELPDNLLVRETRSGNHRAYAELVRRYQDKIYTIVFGQLQSREDALDLTQEVFLKAHVHLANFREDCIFYTWLYRIAINTCIDFNRRRRRLPEPFSFDSEMLTHVGYEPADPRVGADPVRALENQELGRRIRRAIQALPDTLRLAVILHDIEGLPQKEIAAILGCPLGTVKSRIQRGRYEIRARLQLFLKGASG